MSAFDLHSQRNQLVVTALAASLATAGAITAYQDLSRRRRRRVLEDEVRKSVAEAQTAVKELAAVSGRDNAAPALDEASLKEIEEYGYEEHLIREQLARNYAIFGEEGMAKVRGGSAVVVGCGGVGSWAAVMLVRSGIKRIRLIDFDYVTLSSLNRHATAVLADVGTPKVDCVAKVLREFSKWIEIDTKVEQWDKEDGPALLAGFDWVIDAIDNIGSKVDLLEYCHSQKLKIFSSMGAGAKFDPTRIQICDISNTIYDPLARAVRMQLRKRGISHGIPVVYSTEVPESKLLPLPEKEVEKGNVGELAVYAGFRVRILPVLGMLPATFGLHIATYVVCELAGKPITNPLAVKNRHRLYEKIWRDLAAREEKTSSKTTFFDASETFDSNASDASTATLISSGTEATKVDSETSQIMPLDEHDVGTIFEDVHRGRSVVPPHPILTNPKLSRWDFSQPLSLENCVVFDAPELKKHVQGWEKGLMPEQVWGDEVVQVVQRRRQELKIWAQTVL